MNNNEYVRLSLELHLFFDRIMKEHSFFLETSFTEKDQNYKKIANDFQKIFSGILENVIVIADGNISEQLILSKEIVTDNTLDAEKQSSELSGISINSNITLKEINLNTGKIKLNEQLLNDISSLNRQSLQAVSNLINFKNDVLNRVLSCSMYTTNYPLFINHLINEAKMYYDLLATIENKQQIDQNYLYSQELFWNDIMKEHADFIRGLLDPSENELILTADNFSDNYENILKNYANNPVYLTNISLRETINFRNFKVTGEEGILNCQIKSIIIPLLADHVVREANHFIRILNSFNM